MYYAINLYGHPTIEKLRPLAFVMPSTLVFIMPSTFMVFKPLKIAPIGVCRATNPYLCCPQSPMVGKLCCLCELCPERKRRADWCPLYRVLECFWTLNYFASFVSLTYAATPAKT
jgi:hypothetical protein